MDKIKILVAVHKDDAAYHDDVYLPIWAGKAVSKANLPWQGDDTGDNISEKNPNYCEMTVHYWAWKNIKAEYVGLCHYRRYFSTIFTPENIEREMVDCDVILPYAQYHDLPLIYKISGALSVEDKYIFMMVIKQKFPNYFSTMIDYLYNNHKDYAYNMMVCRKKLYDEMMAFVFAVLTECEKYVRMSPYTHSARVFGYYAEYLVPIFCIANRLKIKQMSLVEILPIGNASHVILKHVEPLRWLQSNLRCWFSFPRKTKDFVGVPIVGLKADGIVDENGMLKDVKL